MPKEVKEREELGEIGQEVNDDAGETEEEKKKLSTKRELSKRFWQVLAGLSGIFAILGIVFSDTIIVTIIAGVVAIGVGVVVFINQEKLGDIDGLRKIQNEIRQEVNRFQKQNDELSKEVNVLEENVDKLKESEQQLQNIANEQGSNVSNLVSLVKENGEVQKQMMTSIKSETLQKMCAILFTVDRNSDYQVGENEVSELIMRMKIDPRIKVNEDNLKDKIQKAGGALSIQELSTELITASEGGDDDIFAFVPENVTT